MFDEDRNTHTVTAIKDIRSGEEIFCDYGTNYQLGGKLAGKYDTLAGHIPPPKWYKKLFAAPENLKPFQAFQVNPMFWGLLSTLLQITNF